LSGVEPSPIEIHDEIFTGYWYLNAFCLTHTTTNSYFGEDINTQCPLQGPQRYFSWNTVASFMNTAINEKLTFNSTAGYYTNSAGPADPGQQLLRYDFGSSLNNMTFPMVLFSLFVISFLVPLLVWIAQVTMELVARKGVTPSDVLYTTNIALLAISSLIVLAASAGATWSARSAAILIDILLMGNLNRAVQYSDCIVGPSFLALIWCSTICQFIGTALFAIIEGTRRIIRTTPENEGDETSVAELIGPDTGTGMATASATTVASTGAVIEMRSVPAPTANRDVETGMEDTPPPYTADDPLGRPPSIIGRGATVVDGFSPSLQMTTSWEESSGTEDLGAMVSDGFAPSFDSRSASSVQDTMGRDPVPQYELLPTGGRR
jgi:hypothetical protein